jgi:hypothetical protein
MSTARASQVTATISAALAATGFDAETIIAEGGKGVCIVGRRLP